MEKKYKQKVSLPTIINRAKKNDFYLKKPKRTVHDRKVLTNYAGELIQHDSSHHKWSPYVQEKWYLITSLDDFSRYMLYAQLLTKVASCAHIQALEAVMLKHGLPFSYYVDSHSIFRFVKGRDSLWRKHHKLTDETLLMRGRLYIICSNIQFSAENSTCYIWTLNIKKRDRSPSFLDSCLP